MRQRNFVDAHNIRRPFDFFGGRAVSKLFVRSEAPKVDQRPDRYVQCAVRCFVQADGFGGYGCKIGGNRHRLAGFAHFVETADFRIFAVGGHLPVDLFQKKVQLGFDFFRGREAFEAV